MNTKDMSPASKPNEEPGVAFQSLAAELPLYGGELEEAALRVIRSGWYLHGPETRALEEELASSGSVPGGPQWHCVAVSNGLDALRMMIRAYIELGRLRPGDEVLYPANTYIASVLPLTEFGLVAVPVEPSESDFNIDFSRMEEKITERTRAVMLVHLYGNPAWDEAVVARLRQRGILILEDNAQAIGSLAPGRGLNGTRLTGFLGDCSAVSFYPSKNIGALGDAGAVCTPDADVARMVRTLANYGSDRRYHNIVAGYNCRMDELQAAMLRVKLRHLEDVTERRRATAALYDHVIDHPEVVKPRIFDDRRQVWHQYVVRSPRRDELQRHLASLGIDTQIHYPDPPHRQPCYAGVLDREPLPLAERLSKEVLSLPVACVSADEAERVAAAVNSFR